MEVTETWYMTSLCEVEYNFNLWTVDFLVLTLLEIGSDYISRTTSVSIFVAPLTIMDKL